ncbi:MAG: hypothetical protein ACE5ET_10900, partial [Gammaproteobacteria bacterium]
MLNRFYLFTVRFPKAVLTAVLVAFVLALSQLSSLEWETDARVYFPKGHPAIKYDEYVADVFGVKDSIIIAIVNDQGIFNPATLDRVARISEKVALLPGVLAQRKVDVASLATATVFLGRGDELVNEPLMEEVPQDAAGLERIRKMVYDHADLFVGNLVSADGKATMIRVKLKEGIKHRYRSYFEVKGILMEELGGAGGAWPTAGSWQDGAQQNGGAGQDEWQGGQDGKWQDNGQWGDNDW